MIVYRFNGIPFWTTAPAAQNTLLALIVLGLVLFILFYVRKL